MERHLPTSTLNWDSDIRTLREAEHAGDDYSFKARLPPVIGNIPENERPTFDQLRPPSIPDDYDSFVRLSLDQNDTDYLRRQLPRTFRIIDNDCRYIASIEGRIALSALELRRQLVQVDDVPHFYGLHIDLPSQRPPSFALPIYLVSNRQTTLFYEGPATLHPTAQGLGLRNNLESTRQLVPAPLYGIVRMSFATIHTAPIFSQTTTRTLMRIFTQPREIGSVL